MSVVIAEGVSNSGDLFPTLGSVVNDRLACGIPIVPSRDTGRVCMAGAAMLVLRMALERFNSQMPIEAKRFQEDPTGETGQQAHQKGMLSVARSLKLTRLCWNFLLRTFLQPFY